MDINLKESQVYRDTVLAARLHAVERANRTGKIQVIYSGLDPSNPARLLVYVRFLHQVIPPGALLIETISPDTEA